MKCSKVAVRSKSYLAGCGFDLSIECSVFVGRAVIVAKCDQWTNHQLFVNGTCVLHGVILNNGGVFTLDHEHGLFHSYSLNFVHEDGKRIETETGLIIESLWMYDSRILVRRYFVRAAVEHECLFKLGKQNQPADR